MKNTTNKIFLDYVNSIDHTLNEKDVDAGASMEAFCNVLHTYPKIGKIYVAALTWR